MSEPAFADEWDFNVLEGGLSGYGTVNPDATQPRAITSPVQENAAAQNLTLHNPDRASFSQPPNGDRRRLDEEGAASQEIQPDLPKLRLLQWNEWDEHGAYDEDPPTCIRLRIGSERDSEEADEEKQECDTRRDRASCCFGTFCVLGPSFIQKG